MSGDSFRFTPFRPRFATVLFGCFCAALALGLAAPLAAQNISGVSGAVVKLDEKALGYRLAYDPDNELFAHSLHYQQAFGDWRGRVVVSQSNSGAHGLEFRSVKIEAQRQFLRSDGAGWNSAIRIDGKIPVDGDGPGEVGVGWFNTIDFSNGWQARGNLHLGREVGDRTRDGLTVETRAEATRAVRDRLRLGAQLFSDFNTTSAPGGFDDQRHQIGPVLKFKTSAGPKLELGALFGVSRAAPDATLRLFASYDF